MVKCLWTTPAGTLKIVANTEDYTTNLTAYNKAGRVLWQKREKLAVIVGVHAVDGVLVVETTNNTVSN